MRGGRWRPPPPGKCSVSGKAPRMLKPPGGLTSLVFPAPEAKTHESPGGPLGTEVPRDSLPHQWWEGPPSHPGFGLAPGEPRNLEPGLQGSGWCKSQLRHRSSGGRFRCSEGSQVFSALQTLTSIPSVNPVIIKSLAGNQLFYPSCTQMSWPQTQQALPRGPRSAHCSLGPPTRRSSR